MDITDRQKKILEIVVKEYIDLAQPISSNYIEENYDLDVSSATIRNDLKQLVKKKYLAKPHTSAGRVPIDKGYRYFVNKLLKRRKRGLVDEDLVEEVKRMEEKLEDEIRFLQEFTKFFAHLSHSLTYSYLADRDVFWKEGYEEALHDPEFEDKEKIRSFLTLVDEFEEKMGKDVWDKLEGSEVKIYIGQEAPFHSEDFSILMSKCSFSDKGEGFFAILGPKRMSYDKNLNIINSLVKLLEENHDEE